MDMIYYYYIEAISQEPNLDNYSVTAFINLLILKPAFHIAGEVLVGNNNTSIGIIIWRRNRRGSLIIVCEGICLTQKQSISIYVVRCHKT